MAPDKPCFLYYAPAPATRRTTPRASGSTVRGQFDMGYEAIREQTLARQKDLGIVPPNSGLRRSTRSARRTPGPAPTASGSRTRLHAALGLAQRRREAPVRADGGGLRGFLAHADHHIGRLLDYLEQTDQRDNTLVVLVSDNGASGEGGPNGSVNEMKFANGVPDDMAENLAKLDDLGGPKTYNHYPTGWAMAFNTPFKMWKRYEFNGGTCDPCIISWPAGTKARGEIRGQYHHAIDIVPTILDILGVDPPETIKGHTQSPIDGVSMR